MTEAIEVQEVEARTWLTEQDASVFIGENAAFYLQKWEKHHNSAFKGWNWAAAIFRIEWMVYRKMYAEAVLMVVMTIVLELLLIGLLLLGVRISDSVLKGVVQLVIGLLANALYYKKAVRTVRKTAHMDESQKHIYLEKRGGVNVLGVVAVLTIEFVLFILPFFL